mgnify:CR=1 FL=1
MPTPHGEIEVAWKRDAIGLCLDAKLPLGICGEVRLQLSRGDYELDIAGNWLRKTQVGALLWQRIQV